MRTLKEEIQDQISWLEIEVATCEAMNLDSTTRKKEYELDLFKRILDNLKDG